MSQVVVIARSSRWSGVAFVTDRDAVPSGSYRGDPSVGCCVASTELTAERNKRDVVFVDPGAYITPVGGTSSRS